MDSECHYLLYSNVDNEGSDEAYDCIHCATYCPRKHAISHKRKEEIHGIPFQEALRGRMVPYVQISESEQEREPTPRTILQYVSLGVVVSIKST